MVNMLNFVYSTVDGHFGCFQFGATTKNAGMNNAVYVSSGTVLVFLKSMPGSGNAESLCLLLFKCKTYFPKQCTILHSNIV